MGEFFSYNAPQGVFQHFVVGAHVLSQGGVD
jgi:hypothetical protein